MSKEGGGSGGGGSIGRAVASYTSGQWFKSLQ